METCTLCCGYPSMFGFATWSEARPGLTMVRRSLRERSSSVDRKSKRLVKRGYLH